MEQIKVSRIIKQNNVIIYDFQVSEGLKDFFSGKVFRVEYPENIENVPDSIAVIPFVCNVLPIVWLTDSKLVLDEIDQAFYECIPNVKNGYEAMFPESHFGGELIVLHVTKCDKDADEKCAAFYSGGVDSMQTLLSHVAEKPALISVWGSDVSYDNKEGWELVKQVIQEAAQEYFLPEVTIKSTFRAFDREDILDQAFCEQLKDGWWHGIKHGIGLLGHVAPYAYLHGLSTMYIASSNCPADGEVRCASHPSIDNKVRFAECQIVHDGFQFNRQEKIRNIVKYNKTSGKEKILHLHVCWETQTGDNCCICEKCYRTMVGLLAEQADPMDYGFKYFPSTIKNIKKIVLYSGKMNENLSLQWIPISERVIENVGVLRKTEYWKEIRWLTKTDFKNIEKIHEPFVYRIEKKIRRSKCYCFAKRVRRKLKRCGKN